MDTQEVGEVTVVSMDMGDVQRHWGWILALGILTILAGLLAIVLPLAAALAVEILIGCVFVFYGVLQGIYAWRLRGYRGSVWRFVGAFAALIAGVLLLAFPMAGVITLALVVGLFFLAGGVAKTLLALQMRPLAGWGWLIVSGVLSIVLGVLILVLWPQPAPWIIGLLVGIDLFFAGLWLTGMGLAARAWQG